MITDVPGIRVGHWTDTEARTGCTVVLPPAGGVASGEIRGGAPAEREFALLAPERLVPGVDAVVLTGGSAFGLAACDGAMRWCEENGLGVETPGGRVPIVVGMGLFDLAVGDARVRPDAAAGYAACAAASAGAPATGAVGAGTGASVGNWRGPEHARPGGIGSASVRHGELVVGALVAVNAYGEPIGDAGERPGLEGVPEAPYVGGASGPGGASGGGGASGSGGVPPSGPGGASARGNTTIGVVATNARLDKLGCFLAAQSGHDGFARALEPAHSAFDGDALVALATGAVEAPVELVRLLAARVVEAAIRQAMARGGS